MTFKTLPSNSTQSQGDPTTNNGANLVLLATTSVTPPAASKTLKTADIISIIDEVLDLLGEEM